MSYTRDRVLQIVTDYWRTASTRTSSAASSALNAQLVRDAKYTLSWLKRLLLLETDEAIAELERLDREEDPRVPYIRKHYSRLHRLGVEGWMAEMAQDDYWQTLMLPYEEEEFDDAVRIAADSVDSVLC